ncbi:DUF5334 family protein [Methylobacterium iners]|uniref:DUF5334 family protein n=1 Tax=Methylobacterium iners TaxID=418707 RepID=UPI001EE171BF|nr:DUF5334 family protein [Methylobacterium iners]
MTRIASTLALALLTWPAAAWDGTDGSTGNTVEIEKGQTVRRGREVEFFDYGAGAYRSIDVDSIRQRGRSVEIEGTDSAGNSVTLEMDGNGD